MKIAVALEKHEWGQILDGLRCRAETYEETIRYYESGCAGSEIAEVRDVDEARKLAEIYRGIIGRILKALHRDYWLADYGGGVYKVKRGGV